MSHKTSWDIAGQIAEHLMQEIITKWNIHISVFLAIIATLALASPSLSTTIHYLIYFVTLAIVSVVPFIIREDGASTVIFDITVVGDVIHVIKHVVDNLKNERNFTCQEAAERNAFICTLDLGKEERYSIRFFKLHYYFILPKRGFNHMLIDIYVDAKFCGVLYYSIKGLVESIAYTIKSRSRRHSEVLIPRTLWSELREDLVLELSHLIRVCEDGNLKFMTYT